MTLTENPITSNDKENKTSAEDLRELADANACIVDVTFDDEEEYTQQEVIPEANISTRETISENNTKTAEIANEVKNENSVQKEKTTQTETKEISQDDKIQDFLNENSKYSEAEKSASVSIIKKLMSEFEMTWEEISEDSEMFFVLMEDPLNNWKDQQKKREVEVKEKQVEVKEKQVEVKEKQVEVKEKVAEEEVKKSVNFDTIFKDIINAEENKNKSTSELLVILLNTENIPEKDRKNFEEYQKLLSLSSSNEAFKSEDKAVVEKAVRSGLSGGQSIETTVRELYESPDLSDEARETLAKEYGIPQLNVKPMKTESDVEDLAVHMDKVREKTEVALTQTKEAVKQVEKWTEQLEEKSEELESEITEISVRVEELRQKKEETGFLSDEEEIELAEKEALLGKKENEKEQLEEEKKELAKKEKKLKEQQRELEKQKNKITNEDGYTKFKLRSHNVFVTKEAGVRYNNIRFRNIEGVSSFPIAEGRSFEREYEKMTVFDAFGGEYGAAGKLFEGLRLGDNKTLHGKSMNIGGATSSDALLSSWGLKQQPGEIMSPRHQAKLYKIGKTFDGPGGADESLKTLGIHNPDGSFNKDGWDKVQKYIKENINNENDLTFNAMSKALQGGKTEEKTS